MERVSLKTPLGRAMLLLGVLTLSLACAAPDPDARDPVVSEVKDVNGASLGSVAIPVSCSPKAATHLRRGVALLHNMTYSDAESEFRTASERDEGCVLAYWGMAMSYVHPLWPDVPSDEALDGGLSLLAEARKQGPLTGREEAYVSALESYYRDGRERTEPARLSSYLQGWEGALSEYPDDPEVQLFRALSLTAVAAASDTRIAMQIEAGEIAEDVLQEIPDHAGALHYIIHAYDLPELAARALPAARTYGKVAPENSHALHMTSHIFTRVGSWEESIKYNRRAAEASLRSPINGMTSFHYLHAADYLAYALLQRFDDDGARQVWNYMASLEGPVFDHPASSYAFAAVPARIALERQNWTEASNLSSRWPSTIPWDRYPQFEAITEFARGLGAARAGDLEAAEASVTRLSELRVQAAALPGNYDWETQVQIQELAVRAWIAYADGRSTRALALMNQASELESTTEKNPVTPGEVLPASELLGDMFLDLGRHDEAVRAYESALRRSPNRLNSLFGAGRSAELDGDVETARGYYRQLAAGTIGDSEPEQLRHARGFLAGD